MSARVGITGALVAAACALPALPAAAATPPSLTGSARLEGAFLLSGRITAASGVRGERRGQRFQRTWTFTPGCAVGACQAIGLTRPRSGGSDKIILALRSPGVYAARGRFYVPLRCGRRTYARGESVPFSITVRVTGAVANGSGVVATAVNATYTSRSRTNLTPCVIAPARESASYTGKLVTP